MFQTASYHIAIFYKILVLIIQYKPSNIILRYGIVKI